MRRLIVGLSLSFCLAGAAQAEQLIVVKSTDAAIAPGKAFAGGARVDIAAGRSVTLIGTSGQVVVVQGRAGGVVLPGGGAVAESDAWRMNALKALVSAPPSRRAYGATRGFCPEAQEMQNLSLIVRADQAGCTEEARQAFEAYLARQAKPAQAQP